MTTDQLVDALIEGVPSPRLTRAKVCRELAACLTGGGNAELRRIVRGCKSSRALCGVTLRIALSAAFKRAFDEAIRQFKTVETEELRLVRAFLALDSAYLPNAMWWADQNDHLGKPNPWRVLREMVEYEQTIDQASYSAGVLRLHAEHPDWKDGVNIGA